MDPTQEIDPQIYSRLPPYLDMVTTLALARKLIAAAPTRPSPGARRTVVSLREMSDELDAFLIDALRGSSNADKRPLDFMTDRSWAALEMRLAAWLQMPADEQHEVAAEISEAASLHSRLFPDGLRFTQLEYGSQWVEAETRIKMIKEDRLEQRLAHLCGKPFLDELLRCHAMYGDMVGAVPPAVAGGAGHARPAAERPDAATLKKRLQQAILAHQLQLVAMCMSGDADEATAARLALRPVDDYRERQTQGRPTSRAESPQPSSPALPSPLPDAPPSIPPAG